MGGSDKAPGCSWEKDRGRTATQQAMTRQVRVQVLRLASWMSLTVFLSISEDTRK